MATAPTVQLIHNEEGNIAQILSATNLLKASLQKISNPTLKDVTATHILHVNSTYKPFVLMGYEYQKVAIKNGSAQWGQEISFDLPYYGDFYNDILFHIVLSEVSRKEGPSNTGGFDRVGYRLDGLHTNLVKHYVLKLLKALTTFARMLSEQPTDLEFTPEMIKKIHGYFYDVMEDLHPEYFIVYHIKQIILNADEADDNYKTKIKTEINKIIDCTDNGDYNYNNNTYKNILSLNMKIPENPTLYNHKYEEFIAEFKKFYKYIDPTDAYQKKRDILKMYDDTSLIAVFSNNLNDFNAMSILLQDYPNILALPGYVITNLAVEVKDPGNATPTVVGDYSDAIYNLLYVINDKTTTALINGQGNFDNIAGFNKSLYAMLESKEDTPILDYGNYVRYCEYPGNRIIQKCSFEVTQNKIDEYDWRSNVMYEQTKVQTDKYEKYCQLVGQQIIKKAEGAVHNMSYIDCDISSVSELEVVINTNTPSNISSGDKVQTISQIQSYTDINNTISSIDMAQYLTRTEGSLSTYLVESILSGVVPHNSINHTNVAMQYSENYTNGFQTPKKVQPHMELFVPLDFWFCDRLEKALPIVGASAGMRLITISLCDYKDILFEYQTVFSPDGTPRFAYAGVNKPEILLCELYVNSIFLQEDVHNIYLSKVGFILARIHVNHMSTFNPVPGSTTRVLLSQLKYPIEYLYVTMQPSFNLNPPTTKSEFADGFTETVHFGNPFVYRDWHRFTREITSIPSHTYNLQKTIYRLFSGFIYDENTENNFGGEKFPLWPPISLVPNFQQKTTAWTTMKTFDSLKLTASGNDVIGQHRESFFTDYMNYRYSFGSTKPPSDPGIALITFAAKKGEDNPSGYFNFSAAREQYLEIVSHYASPATPCTLAILASALNFIVVKDGTAMIRFIS